MTNTNPMLLADFYKIGHIAQYPEGTEMVYSTWTPRTSRLEGIDKAVMFGLQGFIKQYLIGYFNDNFFKRPKADVIKEYARVIKYTLGVENPKVDHIEELHDLGHLPIIIHAVPEGTQVPLRVPMLTIYNSHPKFFWLTNFLETLMSAELWQPMTSATISKAYRDILDRYAIETTGSTNGVEFSAHDFSLRGMASAEAGAKSGAGHLLSFVGTDTIPAIAYHEQYYGANVETELVGTSIPATEHSVMCANSDPDSRDEYESFRRLVEDIYPNGFVSIVSDTYDFWKVIGEILPALKDKIMARDGKVVIRPDSGDPVLIMAGDPNAEKGSLEYKGLIECLYDIFGGTVNALGYKVLDPHIGAIYGDSITRERCEAICKRLKEKGFASINAVYGIGSYSFQMTTRDSLGFAMKATFSIINGEDKMLFKDPKTDNGTKRSQRGLVAVLKDEDGNIFYKDGFDRESYAVDEMQHFDLLEPVFVNGDLVREQTLKDIRGVLAGV
jgi:nicotinamide phosphoribosyltransferase